MLIARIEGATRICGEGQGYEPLPLRDELMMNGWPVMVSAWTPTPAELAALNAGASVHVRIVGEIPPPMIVGVGPVPDAPSPCRDMIAADIGCLVSSDVGDLVVFVRSPTYPWMPRLSPDGQHYICDQCQREWKPGAAPGCAPCAAAFARQDHAAGLEARIDEFLIAQHIFAGFDAKALAEFVRAEIAAS